MKVIERFQAAGFDGALRATLQRGMVLSFQRRMAADLQVFFEQVAMGVVLVVATAVGTAGACQSCPDGVIVEDCVFLRAAACDWVCGQAQVIGVVDALPGSVAFAPRTRFTALIVVALAAPAGGTALQSVKAVEGLCANLDGRQSDVARLDGEADGQLRSGVLRIAGFHAGAVGQNALQGPVENVVGKPGGVPTLIGFAHQAS